ncbi:MAG: permease, partial [Alphaproteobacteria bacterium]
LYIQGKPRFISYFLAVLLGAVTPFCSCSSVPLFIGFVEAGIPLGATMAFLTASPMINEVAVVVLGTAMGWNLAAFYVATGLFVGMLGGFLTDLFKLEKYIQTQAPKTCGCACKKEGGKKSDAVPQNNKERILFAWAATREIAGRIWLYIILGIGIGSAIHGYVPEVWFTENLSAENLFAVPLAVLSGIPLYTNATGIIPIAEALMLKGLPIGTILALMMSVTAISLPEMMILQRVLKLRMLLYFAGFLALSFTVIGYLFNALL